jgi:hypothetical protein
VDHIRNGVTDENNHGEGDEIYKYFIRGDTVIGSKVYYKVFKTGASWFDVPFYYENIYTGALRDEHNKFYFVYKDETDEVLLYDFNARVDDTIQVPYSGTFMEKIVSSVDSLPDDRRIIHFNPKEPVIGCGDQYMIEGIGGSGGLLEGPACFHFWTFDNHLVCYVQNGMLVYHDYNTGFNCEVVDLQGNGIYIDSTCVWRIDKQLVTDLTSDFEKINYFISGDTMINAQSYLKLYKSGYQLYIDENNQVNSGFSDSVYMGALREYNHNIYFIRKDEAAEDLLYNFNLLVGEEVDGTILKGDTVRTVDTILDNRKFLYVGESTWENFFMEGIGSDKGLLENEDEHSTLICFMRNNGIIYHNGNGSECNLTYDDLSFPDCDKLTIFPAYPAESDEIKILPRICYQVSYNHPEYPAGREDILTVIDNSILIEQYYYYDDQLNSDSMKMVYPVFDTVMLGSLSPGDYFVEVIIHTIHHTDNHTDTTFYDKSQYLSFTVSQADNRLEIPVIEVPVRVYPVPAKDYIIVESPEAGRAVNSIDIYNILGEKIKTIDLRNESKGSRFEIGINDLRNGIYMIRINTDNSSFAKKIIIEYF